ncbi:unnamed protein product [Adineta steineri]|uniref:Uncharacterized protein n=1 Tax=Adineta steineri TaxID=433720 RepID=A0A814ZHL0_9BILA|nr:unnamed protein product [Adineta steineri]CAF1243684.1 unnamed protein product [Adineta steineri]CAF1263397.1 unnamed protein product [Adineta steineri]
MFSKLVLYFKTLNLFASSSTINNEYELKNERISTRIFILLLTFSLLITLIYTAQVDITHTVEVKNPSIDQFQLLSLRYSDTLHCPCKNLAIHYESFIILKPQFHQLCTSDFIKHNWINHLDSAANIHMSDDFSDIGSLYFLTLASLCRLANETINSALKTFGSTQFIMANALIQNQLEEQIETSIKNFQSSTKFFFFKSHELIRYSIRINQIMTSLFGDMKVLADVESKGIHFSYHAYTNKTCQCRGFRQCIDSLTLRNRQLNQNMSSSLFHIPGLVKSCYLIDAVQYSSLECFYNQSCIMMIEQFLSAPVVLNKQILPLNLSNRSQFHVSSKIYELLFNTMIEEWKETISYIKYFNHCKISLCTYSYTSKFNIIYMITTLISFAGGLTEVFRFLIPRIVKFIRRRFVSPATLVNESRITIRSLIERIRTFNYFSKPSSTEIEIKQQIIATRLFLLLLIILFVILISYYSTVNINILYEIKSPTYEKFIKLVADQHSNPSFSCPCSTLAIMNNKFITVDYILHSFCNSHSLQDALIAYELNLKFHAYDFRNLASTLFSSLSFLCLESDQYIVQRITLFNSTSYIANKALAPETFDLETNKINEAFTQSTTHSFVTMFTLTSMMTQNNMLVNSKMTNFGLNFLKTNSSYSVGVSPISYIMYSKNNTIRCDCLLFTQCYMPLSIYLNTNIQSWYMDIPGFYRGCTLLDSMRYSTLTCLFNESCLNIMTFWLNISYINVLDSNNLKHFKSNSTIAEIMDRIFIDRWNISTSHQAFYKQCNPEKCIYTLFQRNSLLNIVTIVFGLISGLTKILQIIVPFLVKCVFAIYSRCFNRRNRDTSVRSVSSNCSCQMIINRIRKLNFYSSNNSTIENEYEIRSQIIATRILSILLIILIIILTIYSSQTSVTKIVIVSNPSIEKYNSLYRTHSETLSCPCTNIIIPRQIFLILQPTFHQVCRSNFIDPLWSHGLLRTSRIQGLPLYDFRIYGGFIFRTIASLCELSLTTINNELEDFNRSLFTTTHAIPKQILDKQGQSLIDLFISTNENTFFSSIQINNDMTHRNGLISGFALSTHFRWQKIDGIYWKLVKTSDNFGDNTSVCLCHSDPTCRRQAFLLSIQTNITIRYIPGFFIGCYTVGAALKSNLAVFYNQTWIDMFRKIINFDYFNPMSIQTIALNTSRNSLFNTNASIEVIAKKMMIEQWHTHVNYSAYYEHCQPKECKYTYIVKYDINYIITILISLVGSFATVLQWITLPIIKLIRRYCLKRRRQTAVQIISIQD